MRKIITSIILTACVALCAAVWPRSVEVGDLPSESIKTAVTTEIETEAEKSPPLIISAEDNVAAPEAVAETEPIKQSNSETVNNPEPAQPAKPSSKLISPSTQISTEPKSGSKAIIDSKPYIWIPGFGWIVDEGGGSVGTTVGNPGDQFTGNKVGIMGGTVGSDGDINKQVGIMGSGTVAEDMYENGHKIGIMGGDDSHNEKVNTSQPNLPEPTGDVIYIELQPPVVKDSTPPDYKPGQ